MSQIASIVLLMICVILLIAHFVAIKKSTSRNG